MNSAHSSQEEKLKQIKYKVDLKNIKSVVILKKNIFHILIKANYLKL